MSEPSAAKDAAKALTKVEDPAPDLRRDGPAVLAMGALFLVSIGLAMAFSSIFDEPVFSDPDDLTNPLIYLGIVVVFTVLILLIARYAKRIIIKYIILGSVLLTVYYVLEPLLALVLSDATVAEIPRVLPLTVPGMLAFAVGVALTALLWVYPEWYVVDAVGVLVAAGAAGIFGISFGLLPAIVLLVGFAIYDAIAVYRTKHMLDLADSVLELRLPIMFVVPKSRGYSFLEETRRIRKDDDGEKQPREAMFMGLGDAVIPGVLVVASLVALREHAPLVDTGAFPPHLVVALAALAGSFLGFLALMWFVLKGAAHAGLPLLNSGAIAGFLVALLPVYGVAPLVAALPW